MILHHGALGTGATNGGSHPGLGESDVRDARERFGSNTLPAARASTLLDRIVGQLKDPMILLLIGAGAVTTALGDVVDTFVIALVVVLNSAIGVIQEGKAERSLAALEAISAPRATVVRAGSVEIVAASELVPGDIVHLRGGDIVPADMRLLEAYDLQIDEAALTGESLPVSRCANETALSGTVVTRGRGSGIVSATGISSSLGRIASMVADAPRLATPLQRRLSQLSRVLVLAAGAVSGLVFLIGIAQGHPASEMLVVAVSLAVAAVPESLPAVVSVALAMGAYRMARRSAIVRRLPAVETLGSVTVIASDKTGTLTENKMVADLLWVPDGFFGASADCPYDLAIAGRVGAAAAEFTGVRPLLEAAVLCNDAHVSTSGGSGSVVVSGDPLDAALVELALESRIAVHQLRESVPRLSETPFDAVTRVMTTRHRAAAGQTLSIVKGAPEQVFALGDLEIDEDAVRASYDMADQGLRVIAIAISLEQVAERAGPGKFTARLLGLIGIADPVRPTSAAVVRACADAGVRVLMVTGDHPRTAAAVARQVGILGAGSVVVADDLTTHLLGDQIDTVGVFARTRPEQKVEIVRALQDQGHIVAMTGDGVNDAPALRAADIGVAMGKRGTEVARQSAELVLADDDLRTVVAAIDEGRRITTNIRAFLRYALSGGAAEVLVMVVAPFLGMGIPLLPGQILWINMVTHGLPGVAFGSQPANPDAMRKPSKSPDAFILGGGLWKQIAVLGVAIGAVTLAAGAMAVQTDADVATYVFLVLGLAQLAIALSLRTRTSTAGMRRLFNPFTYAVGGAALLQVLAVTAPPLQDLLRTSDVSWQALISLAALACVPSMLVSLARRVHDGEGPKSQQASSMAPEAMAEDSAEADHASTNLKIGREARAASPQDHSSGGDRS